MAGGNDEAFAVGIDSDGTGTLLERPAHAFTKHTKHDRFCGIATFEHEDDRPTNVGSMQIHD